jgi:4-amino-4-deoxy-L-arabinose transferase-like glycosyltransferase
MVVVLGVLVVLSLRLSNTAFIDEALYINAGRDYVSHWVYGTPVAPYGDSFSGVPFAYPVLAAVLDGLGGLAAVRCWSLGCMMLATVCLRSTASRLFGPRAGLLSAVMFVSTGPVVFAGSLGTFDALVAAMIALALWVLVSRSGPGSALLAGAVLGAVPIMKYAGAVFVPAVLAIALLHGDLSRTWRRTLIAGCAAVAVPGAAWLAWSDTIRAGVAFTTSGRAALSPAAAPVLLTWLVLDVGVLLAVAAFGAVTLARRSPRQALVALVLLGAGLELPVAQLRLGEAVSFDKHLAYSALFLAPLAGVGLAALSRRTWRVIPVVPILMVALLFGTSRSASLFETWVNVGPVVSYVENDPKPGLYLSSAADSLAYHTSALPGVTWETTFSLYAEGTDAIRQAIDDRRFQVIILRSASTGSPTQDAGQAALLTEVRASSSYRLVSTFPARSDTDTWLILERVPL